MYLRHLLTADSQRLLVAARTSTAVLDRTLKAAADTVGGATPDLVARFTNSLNRAFHNVVVSELRQKVICRKDEGPCNDNKWKNRISLDTWLFICVDRVTHILCVSQIWMVILRCDTSVNN